MPINEPGTCRSYAISGAAVGTENSAMVAKVCTARVAASGQIGISRKLASIDGAASRAGAGLVTAAARRRTSPSPAPRPSRHRPRDCPR